jgi:kynureninase
MITQAQVQELDRKDPLNKYVSEFVKDDPTLCYLDGNSLGRLPKQTIENINDFLTNEWGKELVNGWTHWIDEAQRVGDLVGEASLGAKSGQVLVTDTTSINFYRACKAAISARPGRKTIIIDEANFPTDRYILQGIAKELNLKLVTIQNDIRSESGKYNGSDESITIAELEKHLTDDVALVTFSVIQYRSGALNDVKELTKLIHKNGSLVVWDASHAIGVVDLQFDRDDVDLAIGCTYKYGNSGPGAPAWIYVSQKLQNELSMPIQGWFAQKDQFIMGSEFEKAEGMRGFQIASPSILGLRCVKTSFEMIKAASLRTISEKAAIGTSLMIEMFDELLAPLGLELTTPRDSNKRGGHISIHHIDAEKIARGLRIDKNVIPDYRVPNCIRLAISPLTNSYEEIWEGFIRIADYVKSGDYQLLGEAKSSVT